MDLYKDKMSLSNLEKKINSELTTKINSSRINHNQLEIQINKDSLLDVVIFLKKNNLNVYATSLNGEKNIDKINYNKSCAVVVGSENLGISKFWDAKSDELIKIPMLGSIDSLNVSVSAAIVLYEINRQNDFNR